MVEEKQKFEQSQAKVREDLGYKPFKPGQKSPEVLKLEEEEKKRELASLEGKDQKKEQAKEFPSAEMKRFMEIFNAAEENIYWKKPFEFTSMSLDDFGRPSKHHAVMKKLVDHSQHEDLQSDKIRQRLEKKETKPWQIGLQIEIDMGEDKNNHLGLTNLELEVSVTSLLEGHFSEKLARFTNLAFFAASLHQKSKNSQMEKPKEKASKNEPKINQSATTQGQKYGVSKIGEDAALAVIAPAIAIGPNAPAAFAFNHGSVWGTIESQGNPANPKELQEALDKISKET